MMAARFLPIALTLLAGSQAYAVDVRICTTRGVVDVDLDESGAPLHTANFVRYAESGFYDGTILHRAVRGSIVQGGSYDLALERRQAGAPVASESDNGISNQRGTIAASRSDDPDSATSQFFFNLSDNTHLDAGPASPGYTVFGRVTAGLEVLDAVAAQPTSRIADLDEVPTPIVEVEAVSVLDRAPVFGLSIEPDPAALQADFERMQARGDAAGTLAAIDALKRSCIDLDNSQRLAEAEAAEALGLTARARYALERYEGNLNPLDPPRPDDRLDPIRANSLDPNPLEPNPLGPARPGAGDPRIALPPAVQDRDVEELIRQCGRRPVPPSIPDGRSAQRAILAAVENGMRTYREQSESYLACVARRIESGDLNQAEVRSLTRHHNEVVFELTAALTRFNQAVREFADSRG